MINADTFCINTSNLIEIYYGKFAFAERNTSNLYRIGIMFWSLVLYTIKFALYANTACDACIFFSFKYFVQTRKIAFERCCLWPKFSFSILFFCFLHFFCSLSISIGCTLCSYPLVRLFSFSRRFFVCLIFFRYLSVLSAAFVLLLLFLFFFKNFFLLDNVSCM